MYPRIKTVDGRTYLQIVESYREGAKTRQRVIATLGRLDKLTEKGEVDNLLLRLARFADQHARCGISCGGFAGLSRYGKWSTWAPADHTIPEGDVEMVKLLAELAAKYFQKRTEHPGLPNFFRLNQPMPGYPDDRQGILARSRFDTHTTCGNCAIVCFEDKEKTARTRRSLKRSGLVSEDEDGSVRVVKRER